MPVHLTGVQLDNNYFGSAAINAPVAINATSSGTANTCIATGVFTTERDANCLIECYAPFLTIGTTNLDVELWDGATFLQSLSGHMAASIPRPGVTMLASQLLKAGVHNITVKAFVDAGAGSFGAGSGATGAAPNALLFVGPE